MNIEETKKAIEVMQAYVDGKTIIAENGACFKLDGIKSTGIHWSWLNDISMYSVKPEPIERWIAVFTSGGVGAAAHATKNSALAQYGAVDAIKLVEEI